MTECRIQEVSLMAREKTRRVVFTFHTTTMAMMMEQCARKTGAQGRLIPVPRQISAGCGMAWSAPAEERAGTGVPDTGKWIEVEGSYELLL